jgi:hypothetical protein
MKMDRLTERASDESTSKYIVSFSILCLLDVVGNADQMYSQQHVRLYKTVKFRQKIFNLIYFTVKLRMDWEYLTFGTNMSCCCPYIHNFTPVPLRGRQTSFPSIYYNPYSLITF